MILSDKQAEALRAIASGGVLAFYRSGNLISYLNDSGRGFAESTIRSLRNRGLVENSDSPTLTDSGKAILDDWKQP